MQQALKVLRVLRALRALKVLQVQVEPVVFKAHKVLLEHLV